MHNWRMRLKDGAVDYKKQHLSRRHQLATSRDPQIREVHGRFAAFQHRNKSNALRHQWLECVEMDELLAEVKTGRRKKEPLAMGLVWDMGCGESGADHKINT